MRLTAAVQGDLKAYLASELRAAQRGVRAGMKDAATGLRDELRRDAEGADLGRLGRAWRFRVYRGRDPLDSSALIYPKGGARTRGALWAFQRGAVIRPKRGRYLWIATPFNLKRGRRGPRVLFRPEELKTGFVRRSKDGNLLMFARVQEAAKRLKSGRIRQLAAVNDHMLGSGRVRRTEKILRVGAVPMFILKRQVRISKRLDTAAIAEKWFSRLPALIVKHWEKESGSGR